MTINNNLTTNDITAVILAGGRAKRMQGQDKGLLIINGEAMVNIILQRIRPQVTNVFINANRHIDEYKKIHPNIISDENILDFYGPLAGMLSVMKICDTTYLLTLPCDSPFFPENLSLRLLSTLLQESADICVVHDGNRMQPVFALIKTSLRSSLQNYLDNGDRKIDRWYQQHNYVLADISDYRDISLNINTPEELLIFENKLKQKVDVCL
jgi:molybdenum cofactor guanylyltransferase